MHPDLGKDVELGTYQYEGSDVTYYYAKNAEGKEFTLPRRVWEALMKADGTAPLDLPNQGKALLPKLERDGLVRTSRFAREDGPFNRFVLFVFKKKEPRRVPKIWKGADLLFSVLAFVSFAIGFSLVMRKGMVFDGTVNLPLYVAAILIALVLHEVAHALVGKAHGYELQEVGLLLYKIFPCGAYVANYERENEPQWGRFRLFSAGLEMNFFLAGIFYILAAKGGARSTDLFGIGYLNALLAVGNAFPLSGIDGEGALSALCGVESIQKLARKTLFSPRKRKRLLRGGLLGIGAFLFLGAVLLARVCFFLLALVAIVYAFFATPV